MAKPAPGTTAAVVTRMADIEHTQNAEDVAGFIWPLSLDALGHRLRAAPGRNSGDPGLHRRPCCPGAFKAGFVTYQVERDFPLQRVGDQWPSMRLTAAYDRQNRRSCKGWRCSPGLSPDGGVAAERPQAYEHSASLVVRAKCDWESASAESLGPPSGYCAHGSAKNGCVERRVHSPWARWGPPGGGSPADRRRTLCLRSGGPGARACARGPRRPRRACGWWCRRPDAGSRKPDRRRGRSAPSRCPRPGR